MRIIRLLICSGYWALLTVLLVLPDPSAVVGFRKVPTFPWGDMGIHFAAFAILAVMIHVARWPQIPGRLIVVVLLVYGIATELLQALIPRRAVEAADCVENILGIVVGTGHYRFVQGAMLSRCLAKQCAAEATSQSPQIEPGVTGSTAASQV
jgi:hypothetical protein